MRPVAAAIVIFTIKVYTELRFTNRRLEICGVSHRSVQSDVSGMRMVSFCMWKEGLVAGGDDKATDF